MRIVFLLGKQLRKLEFVVSELVVTVQYPCKKCTRTFIRQFKDAILVCSPAEDSKILVGGHKDIENLLRVKVSLLKLEGGGAPAP